MRTSGVESPGVNLQEGESTAFGQQHAKCSVNLNGASDEAKDKGAVRRQCISKESAAQHGARNRNKNPTNRRRGTANANHGPANGIHSATASESGLGRYPRVTAAAAAAASSSA